MLIFHHLPVHAVRSRCVPTDRSNGTPLRMKLCFATDETAFLHETHKNRQIFHHRLCFFPSPRCFSLWSRLKSYDHIQLNTHQGFSQKPVAEPKERIRSYRAVALTSVVSKWYVSCIILRLEQEREPENWKKLDVGGLNGRSCPHMVVMAT